MTRAHAGPRRRTVVHVVTSLDFGGVETQMEIVGESAHASAYDHVFCAIGGGGRAAAALERQGATVECLHVPARIPSISAVRQLYRLFRRLRPEVVYAHGAEANFHGLLAAAIAGVPVRIGEEIGIPVHGPVAARVFAACYRLAHRVVGVSGCVSSWLVASGEVPRHKVATLTLPARLAASGELPSPCRGDRWRGCFVGRLEPVKNLDALLRAFAALVRSGADAELWLMGQGSSGPSLQADARKLGIEGRVSFLGYQRRPDEWVRRCHVCIQPSLSEGFGLAMVEAMGCGVPVLSTPVGAAPDIIADGVNGWLTDGFDELALLRGLQRAYRATAELDSIGGAARKAVATLVDPERYMERLDGLLSDCVPPPLESR